jgi:hypothetical protein
MKHYVFEAIIMPASGRAKERCFLARRAIGGKLMIIAEFRNQSVLDDVVKSLEGEFAYRLMRAELHAKIAAE